MTEHTHTNRLLNETSPYLLQHAHNPVDWFPWGVEALAKARQEDKPILLSVGYSACHWCHVMAHESFEDEATARLMNERFVNIKVDREERPDLDQIYMNAVQLMTGHGGWPLTVFLTPDLVPYFGGTYFPPADRHGMPSFTRVLTGIADAYRAQPDEVAQTAASVLSELRRMNHAHESNGEINISLLDAAAAGIKRTYDPTHGGFGNAPKFPAPMTLEFLLRSHRRTGDADALLIVEHTCRRMAEGGMYDQVGGGFHRYSTDARWLVPHFEKMLYDNALLSRLYLHVYQATGDEFYRRIVEETLDYVVREMTGTHGGFYSTQDADSESVEGKFFVWTVNEISRHLGTADARLFCAYYDVSEGGNFEGENILNVARPVAEVARALNVTTSELTAALGRGRQILFELREQRVKPGRDEKVLAAWNGMMLASFSEAAAVLDRADYRGVAERNAEFILDTMQRDGRLLHVFKDGQAKLDGYLDDYACVASGLLVLYETTGATRWLEAVDDLAERTMREFWDTDEGGFFYTAASGELLIVRHKDYYDNATPSGNSVAADVLLRLAAFTGNEDYRRRAVNVFRLVREAVTRHPSAFGRLLGALDFYLSTPTEIAIIGAPEAPDTRLLTRAIWTRYLPNKLVALAAPDDEMAARLTPLLRDRHQAPEQRATAYVCEHYACQQPVTEPHELAAQLDGAARRERAFGD